MIQTLSPALLAALTELDTCAVANAIESFDFRLRNEGFCDSTIQCRYPMLGPTVGHAVTLRVRSGNPPMQGGAYEEATDWWETVVSQPSPRILVIEDADRRPGVGALVGGVHAAILQAMGCVGVVTNGAVRDLNDVERLGFGFFSSHVSPSHAYVHVVEAGGPVTLGGLKIRPGELLHGDRHGLLRVPRRLVPEIPEVAARLRAHEQRIVAYCRSGEFTKEGLRTLLQAQG